MQQAHGQVTTLIGDTFIPSSAAVALMAALPCFDFHKVEQALRVNHVLYNGTPLTEEEIASGIEGYRQFLARHKAAGMPERFEVPSFLIDRVWHTHICETDQYSADMVAYFGKMLHHRSDICNGGAEDIRPDGDPSTITH